MSQKVLVGNLDQAPDEARVAIHSLSGMSPVRIRATVSRLSCARVDALMASFLARDEWSDDVGERGAVMLRRAASDTTLPFTRT
jgi:hypothetical protein